MVVVVVVDVEVVGVVVAGIVVETGSCRRLLDMTVAAAPATSVLALKKLLDLSPPDASERLCKVNFVCNK